MDGFFGKLVCMLVWYDMIKNGNKVTGRSKNPPK
jgi:hypothetical protein